MWFLYANNRVTALEWAEPLSGACHAKPSLGRGHKIQGCSAPVLCVWRMVSDPIQLWNEALSSNTALPDLMFSAWSYSEWNLCFCSRWTPKFPCMGHLSECTGPVCIHVAKLQLNTFLSSHATHKSRFEILYYSRCNKTQCKGSTFKLILLWALFSGDG